MRFYVKWSNDAEIEGPITIDQINKMLRQDRLTPDSPTIADSWQKLEELRNVPAEQWTKVKDLPGYDSEYTKKQKRSSRNLVITVLLVIIPLVLILWVVSLLREIH